MLAAGRPAPVTLAIVWSGAAAFLLSLLFFLYSYFVPFGAGTTSGSAPRAIAVDVLLFSLFAAHHSVLAREGPKRVAQRLFGPVLERSAYTWTASALFVLVCWWWRPVPGELYRLAGAAALPAYVAQGLGIAITIRSSARLGVLELAGVRPALEGGRPAAAPPRLETRGAYAVVRHPLYLGWALFVFGTPHMTATRLVFAAVSTAYLALAIPFEERGLVRTFGDEYRRYRARVRWRMIPGLY